MGVFVGVVIGFVLFGEQFEDDDLSMSNKQLSSLFKSFLTGLFGCLGVFGCVLAPNVFLESSKRTTRKKRN